MTAEKFASVQIRASVPDAAVKASITCQNLKLGGRGGLSTSAAERTVFGSVFLSARRVSRQARGKPWNLAVACVA